MEIEVIKFDNLGRGIGYIDNKIVFIPKSIPGDIVEIKISKEKKNFLEGEILKIITPSKLRKEVKCPYFNNCGGCDLMHISISEELEYKLSKINEILEKNKINYKVKEIIKSDWHYNYRNKVSLKIVNGNIGFFQDKSHELVKIDYCYLCKEEINLLINDLNELEIMNGNITIRCNYNNEMLIIIETEDDIQNIDKIINNHKIVGILKNNQCIYGNDYFIEKINNYLFKVSYNSFFQINPFICSKLFELIKKYTNESKNILDLYCGVGTLGIVASSNDNDSKKILGIEIVENAINNAQINKSFNNIKNCDFICDDTENILDKISNIYDTLIMDPPRSGVNVNVINKIIDENIEKIIYISCDPQTLARDLKLLETNYAIEEFILLDMFPNTHHVESFVLLQHKK